jgi:hypothetical protein
MRRALIAGGLSIALLAAAASSASAATISPASLNFGTQRLNTTSAPQTFTLTKGSETTFGINPILVDDSFSYLSTTNCPPFLTAATPSCTMTFRYKPRRPGPDNATLYTSEGSSTAPTATLTGTGVVAGKKCKKGTKLSAQSAKKKKCGKKKNHL